jgi:predicted enzyme related to lactoylglutathione lyase
MERVQGIGLDAMLEQLAAAGVPVEEERQHERGVGRFAWLSDPEGNRIELWEPDRAILDQS